MTLHIWTNTAPTSDYAWSAGQAIAEKVDAHPGWVLVETYMPSTTKYFVLKCLAASSGLYKDFYVILRAPNGSSAALTWMIAEDYDLATHKFRRAAMQVGYSQSVILSADGSISGDTWIGFGETLSNNGNALNPMWGSVTIATVPITQEFVLSVQAKALVVYAKNDTTPNYIGVFDSYIPDWQTNDPMPLLCLADGRGTIGAYGSNAPWNYTTRHPMKGGSNLVHGTMVGQMSISNAAFSSWSSRMNPGIVNSGDLFQGGKPSLWSIPVLMYSQSMAGDNTATHGLVRGSTQILRYMPLPVVAGGYLDSITVGTDTWLYLASDFWVNQAAS